METEIKPEGRSMKWTALDYLIASIYLAGAALVVSISLVWGMHIMWFATGLFIGNHLRGTK
jgi:hypothetical protein